MRESYGFNVGEEGPLLEGGEHGSVELRGDEVRQNATPV